MTTIAGYLVHPAAELFPLLEGPEFEALVDDIRTNGQAEPITLHEGVLLDGRNRARACERLGRQPKTREWTGTGNATSWVLSENLRRRHLDEAQRAFATQGSIPLLAAEGRDRQREAGEATRDKPRESDAFQLERNKLPATWREPSLERHARETAEQAAKLFGVSGRSVQRVKSAIERAPELGPLLRDGKLTCRAAEQISRLEPGPRAQALGQIESGEKPQKAIWRAIVPSQDASGVVADTLHPERYGALVSNIERMLPLLPESIRPLFEAAVGLCRAKRSEHRVLSAKLDSMIRQVSAR